MRAKLYTILQSHNLATVATNTVANISSQKVAVRTFYIQSKIETICESISIFSNHNCFVLPLIYLILINLIYFVPVRRVVPRRVVTNVFMFGISNYCRSYLCICLFALSFLLTRTWTFYLRRKCYCRESREIILAQGNPSAQLILP